MKKKTMIKVLSALSIASLAFVFAGCGNKVKPTTKPTDDDDIKYDSNLKMKYKEFNGEAEIVEIEKQGATLTIPATIGPNNSKVTRVSCTYADDKDLTKVVISDNLVYFNGNGFMNCENLAEVEFGSNPQITTIPSKAFMGTKITSITIPASVKAISYEAFQNVETLTTVTIASGSTLETIGPFAFYNCNKIQTINLPDSLVTISDSAFEKCSSLSTLTLGSTDDNNLKYIEQSAFSGCEKLETLDFSENKNLTRIGANAFRGCISLNSVTFDTALQEIGSKAFYDTRNITSLVLPEHISSIGDEAFVNAGLTALEIKTGSDVLIGNNAFTQYDLVEIVKEYKEGEPKEYDLVPLEKITTLTSNGNLSLATIFTSYAPYVRNSLTTLNVTGDKIAANAYKGCTKLVNLNVANTVKAMGESAFEECTLITAVALNEGLTEVSKNTFKNCINLETVTLPSTVLRVRDGAFDGCVKVANLDLDNLTYIGAAAFRNTAISTPTFSSDIETIGENAFDGCSEIEKVDITTPKVTVIKQYAFANCTNITEIKLSSGTIVEPNVFVNDTNVTKLHIRGEYGIESLFGEAMEAVAKTINDVEILEGTEEIEAKAFSGCILVSNITIPDTVKIIGDEAFKGCGGITTLDLPDGLNKIGKYAFANCDKLVISSLPESITQINEGLFKNDSAISTFTINDSVTTIGASAFEGCSNLVIDVLNDNIVTIGDSAFKGCVNLAISDLPDELTSLGSEAFSGCLLIKVTSTNNKLTRIGDKAFYGCKAIEEFDFVNDLGATEKLGKAVLEGCTQISKLRVYGTTSLEYIFGESYKALKDVLSIVYLKGTEIELADNMFRGFTAISSVILEDQINGVITKIGESAFEGCESLTSFDGMENVKEIGDNAFAGSGIASVVIPSNGIILGNYIFSGCKSLYDVTFAPKVAEDKLNIKEIPSGTFKDTIIVEITIPDTVERIGKNAFSGILTLNTVTINIDTARLISIGETAFANCTNLKAFTISKNVEAMGDGAFSGCISLKTVTFSTANKIEYIADGGFENCLALTTINMPNTVRDIRSKAFYNCGCLTGGETLLPTSLELLGISAFEGAVSINNIVIPEKVEKIADKTFKSCYMLTTVDWTTLNNGNIKEIGSEAFCNTPYKTALPKSINYIGDSAFANTGDKNGENFKFPRTFENVSVELGTIDDGVGLVIADNAFKYSALSGVTLGSKITELGDSLFFGSSVATVNLSALKITALSTSMFEECGSLGTVTMTGNTTINTIGDKAFYKSSVTSFVFTNILSIGESAFEECEGLAVELSLGVGEDAKNVTIGKRAFYKSGITALTLGEKVIGIGKEAFSEAGDLESATLTELDITEISDNFFAKCAKLNTVSINVEKIRTIGKNAFEGTSITSLGFLIVENKTTVLEQILDNAFKDCKGGDGSADGLVSAVIPNTVSYVGAGAFSGCTDLASVTWSTGANAILDDTFNGCNVLTDFVVKENVNNIGKHVFSTQTAKTITFESVTPPSVDIEFLNGADKFTLSVPNVANYNANYNFKNCGATISQA